MGGIDGSSFAATRCSITVALGDHGAISHVIDDTGEATAIHPRVTPKVTDFPCVDTPVAAFVGRATSGKCETSSKRAARIR